MIYAGVGQLPRHLYVWVDSKFTHRKSVGWIPAVWFGLVSHHGRAWGLTVLLENGAVYRNLPPHAVAFSKDPVVGWTIEDAQTWDCYGEKFSTIEYEYLSSLAVRAKTSNGAIYDGRYLFSVLPIGDGFSEYPEQAKEFTFIRTDGDRLTIQPTNNVLIEEKSFTSVGEFPSDLRRQTEVWDVE